MAQGVSKARHIAQRLKLFSDWYKLVFPFNRLVSREQILHLRNGVSAQVGDIFSSDVSVLMEVFSENAYHLERLALPPGAIIVDIGANIGAFSLASRSQFPDASIIAFEPSPRNFILLERNAPFARVVQKAVAGASGSVQIQSEGTHTALHLVDTGGTEVEALSLEDALRDLTKVDLLKVDIEGAEYDVFAHASPAVLKKVGTVLMEVHNPEHRPWVEDLLSKNGFSVEWYAPALLCAHK